MLDVIIIGAGAAGLAAARELHKNKVRFQILEARERVGGRASTLSKHFPIELGPEFVHGEAKRVNAYLEEQGLSSFEIPDLHHSFERGKLRPIEIWNPIAETLKKIPKQKQDCSLAEGLKKTRDAPAKDIEATRAYFQGFDAVLIDKVSLKQMLSTQSQVTQPDERRVGRTLEGYQSLFTSIAQPFQSKIRFNCIVEKVVWKKGEVRVQLASSGLQAGKTLRAKKLLVTVPVGVLKQTAGTKGAIDFLPTLKQKQLALEYLEMGPVVKLGLEFTSDFWSKKFHGPVAMFHARKNYFQTWWTASPMHWPLITAWSGGDPALALSTLAPNEQEKLALEELAPMLKSSVKFLKKNLIKMHHHDWLSDPFARGAYSFVKVGGEKARARLGRPVEQTLYFAGEATSTEQNGTIEGALETGERAAGLILRSL